jgi:hypothetical protein
MVTRAGTDLGPSSDLRPGTDLGAPIDPSVMAVEGDVVTVAGVTVRDPVLAGVVSRTDPADRAELLERLLAVGARGLATMGVGVDLAEVDLRVARTVERATDEAALRAQAMLEEAHRLMTSSLDPEQRSSLVSRAVADFATWRDGFLAQVDPDSGDSHTGRLLHRLHELLGPSGALEQRLTAALDPTADGSGLAKVSELVDRRFVELRELLAEERGRRTESDRGTAKGFDYEDVVEEHLRSLARQTGALVERTSRVAGSLAGESIVGDLVLTWPDGRRVVVEAKNVRSLALSGKDGMLAQLDRAMANREAQMAVCVSAQDAYPSEVGVFGVYGNRILIVDEGDGVMLAVAVRWASLQMAIASQPSGEVDTAAVDERLVRIKTLSQRFSINRRALTEIGGSVEKVKGSLEEMRRELVDLVDDASALLTRRPPGHVVDLHRHAG